MYALSWQSPFTPMPGGDKGQKALLPFVSTRTTILDSTVHVVLVVVARRPFVVLLVTSKSDCCEGRGEGAALRGRSGRMEAPLGEGGLGLGLNGTSVSIKTQEAFTSVRSVNDGAHNSSAPFLSTACSVQQDAIH